MKNLAFSLSMLTFLVFSCEKKSTETVVKPDFDSTSVADETASDIVPIETKCFLATDGKDSLLVSYEDNLGTIVGKMRYKNFEKDSSKGDISGLIDGDTLKLSYLFESEGTSSSREIWFLKRNSQLLEGIGKYNASGDAYADYKNIKFDEGRTLNSVPCKDIEKELK